MTAAAPALPGNHAQQLMQEPLVVKAFSIAQQLPAGFLEHGAVCHPEERLPVRIVQVEIYCWITFHKTADDLTENRPQEARFLKKEHIAPR